MVRDPSLIEGIEKIGDLHLVGDVPDHFPGGGELSSHQDIHLVHGGQLPCDGGHFFEVRMEVPEEQADFFAQDAAGRIDLVDGQLVGIAAAGGNIRIGPGDGSDHADQDLVLFFRVFIFPVRQDHHLVGQADLDGKALSLDR